MFVIKEFNLFHDLRLFQNTLKIENQKVLIFSVGIERDQWHDQFSPFFDASKNFMKAT